MRPSASAKCRKRTMSCPIRKSDKATTDLDTRESARPAASRAAVRKAGVPLAPADPAARAQPGPTSSPEISRAATSAPSSRRCSVAPAPGAAAGVGRARARPAQPQRGEDVEHTIAVTFMTAALGGTEQLRIGSGVGGGASTINVKIPPGIEPGAKLRIKGKGQPSPTGGPRGDLILTIDVGNHPYF